MNKILNYLEDDNWYKIFDAENEEDIEYKLLEREEVETLLKEIERLNNIIDKAIKYMTIEARDDYFYKEKLYGADIKLLEILQGSDKE